MKLKFLATLSLLAFLFLTGCGGNKDNTNVNANANKPAATATPTPIAQTTEAPKTDPALKGKIESALKAKGLNDVMIDTSGPKLIARGTVPKGKLMDATKAIMENNDGKPFDNQIAEK